MFRTASNRGQKVVVATFVLAISIMGLLVYSEYKSSEGFTRDAVLDLIAYGIGLLIAVCAITFYPIFLSHRYVITINPTTKEVSYTERIKMEATERVIPFRDLGDIVVKAMNHDHLAEEFTRTSVTLELVDRPSIPLGTGTRQNALELSKRFSELTGCKEVRVPFGDGDR